MIKEFSVNFAEQSTECRTNKGHGELRIYHDTNPYNSPIDRDTMLIIFEGDIRDFNERLSKLQ